MIPEVTTRVELFGDCQVPVHVPTDPVRGQLRLLNGERADLERRIQSDVGQCLALARRAQCACLSAYAQCASSADEYQRNVDAIDWCNVSEEVAHHAAELVHNAADLEARFGAERTLVHEVACVLEPFLRRDLQLISPCDAPRGGAVTFTGLPEPESLKASGLHALGVNWPDKFDGALDLFFLRMRREVRDLVTAYDAALATARELIEVEDSRARRLRSLRSELEAAIAAFGKKC